MTDGHSRAAAEPGQPQPVPATDTYTRVPVAASDYSYSDDPYLERPSEPADYAQPYAGLDEPGG
jgi:hypothetical protein